MVFYKLKKLLSSWYNRSKIMPLFIFIFIFIIINTTIVFIFKDAYIPFNKSDSHIIGIILRNILIHIVAIVMAIIALEFFAYIIFASINIIYGIFSPIIEFINNIIDKIKYRETTNLKYCLKTLNVIYDETNECYYNLNKIIKDIKKQYKKFKYMNTKSDEFTNYYTSFSLKKCSDNNSLIIEMYQTRKPKAINQDGRDVYFYNTHDFPGGTLYPVLVFSEYITCKKTEKGYIMY